MKMGLLLLIVVCFASCGRLIPEFSEIGGPTGAEAPYPTLEPVGPLIAAANSESTVDPDAKIVAARMAALKAKAAALRGKDIAAGADALKELRLNNTI